MAQRRSHGWLWVVGGLGVACDTPEPCEALSSGSYAASGTCFGMEMTVTLEAVAEAPADTCALQFSEWSMNHGDLPTGGTLTDGEEVSLAGTGFEGCTGSTQDGLRVEGLCPSGCAWELALDAR